MSGVNISQDDAVFLKIPFLSGLQIILQKQGISVATYSNTFFNLNPVQILIL